jgi:4'-phosphopantetheinyl transferase EntD
MTAMLGSLLPSWVECHEHFGEAVDGYLFPEEEKVVERAVDGRRRQYATVRRCARAGLAGLGHPPTPILPGRGGAPAWPAGVRGSMTHCSQYAAAAVAPSERVVTIGIDAEPDAPLPAGVLELVATPEECLRLPTPRTSQPCWDRLLFSAKESVYKAWFPVVREWLDPLETVVAIAEDGWFTAALLRDGLADGSSRISRLRGRWAAGGGIVLTGVIVSA